MARGVLFYRTAAGRSPIEEFLEKLSPKQAQKVVWVLRLIEDLDMVPTTYFKKMSNTDEWFEEVY